jgi:hypothetical protein
MMRSPQISSTPGEPAKSRQTHGANPLLGLRLWVREFGDEALIEAALPQSVDRAGYVAAKLVCAAAGPRLATPIRQDAEF